MVKTRYPKTRTLMYVLLVASAAVILIEWVTLSYGQMDWSLCRFQKDLGLDVPTPADASMTTHALVVLSSILLFVGFKLPLLLTIIITARKWTAISAFIVLSLPFILLIVPNLFDVVWYACDRKGCTECLWFLAFQFLIVLPIGGVQLVYALVTRFYFDRGKYSSPT
jgi:hypothetical protein